MPPARLLAMLRAACCQATPPDTRSTRLLPPHTPSPPQVSQMFTKGLSSLSTLAGSAAATAREKAQQAHLDQTAAVRGSLPVLLALALALAWRLQCCFSIFAAAAAAAAAASCMPMPVSPPACCTRPSLSPVQAAAEKAKEVGAKSWSFLKSAYASAASAIEQTAAQVRRGHARRWRRCWRGGRLCLGG